HSADPAQDPGLGGLDLCRPGSELRRCVRPASEVMRDTSVIDHYLAPLRPYLEPATVTEVVVNRPTEVGVEGPDGWRWHTAPELTENWLRTLAVAAAAYTGQDVDAERPICSTVLPGDARCQIVLPPVVPAGTVSL